MFLAPGSLQSDGDCWSLMWNNARFLSKKLAAGISGCLIFLAGAAVCKWGLHEQSHRLRCILGLWTAAPTVLQLQGQGRKGMQVRVGRKRGRERETGQLRRKKETRWGLGDNVYWNIWSFPVDAQVYSTQTRLWSGSTVSTVKHAARFPHFVA